jgi:hypothetical protein
MRERKKKRSRRTMQRSFDAIAIRAIVGWNYAIKSA